MTGTYPFHGGVRRRVPDTPHGKPMTGYSIHSSGVLTAAVGDPVMGYSVHPYRVQNIRIPRPRMSEDMRTHKRVIKRTHKGLFVLVDRNKIWDDYPDIKSKMLLFPSLFCDLRSLKTWLKDRGCVLPVIWRAG
jgi:hypothetical protein